MVKRVMSMSSKDRKKLIKRIKVSKAINKSVATKALKSGSSLGASGNGPLPLVNIQPMRFATRGTLDAGAAGVIATTTTTLNALQTNKPAGFDAFGGTFYRKYQPLNTRIQLIAAGGQTGGLQSSAIVGMIVSDSAVPPATFIEAVENGRGVYKVIGPGGSNEPVELDFYVDIAKYLDKDENDENLEATYTTNPAYTLFLHIYVQSLDAAVDLNDLAYLYVQETRVRWSQPNAALA